LKLTIVTKRLAKELHADLWAKAIQENVNRIEQQKLEIEKAESEAPFKDKTRTELMKLCKEENLTYNEEDDEKDLMVKLGYKRSRISDTNKGIKYKGNYTVYQPTCFRNPFFKRLGSTDSLRTY
jgi:hypothetical protein